MGSPSEATLLRRELVAVHRRYGAEIGALRDDNRQLVSGLSEVSAERDGLRITCRLQEAALATATGTIAELNEKCKRAEEDKEKLRGLLRRHENPNSPTSSRAVCHRERDKLRAEIGSYNEGDRGRRGDAQEQGRERRGRAAKGGAAPGRVEDKGEEVEDKGEEVEDGKKGSEEEEEEGQGAAASTHGRRRRGPGRSNSTKTECTLTVELGPSWCCGASHVVIGYFVKRHYDLIGGWLLAFDASDDRGRRLQDLARDAVRIGGVGRACAVALKFEVGCCSACGLPEKASTPISIPRTALGVIIRERLLDLTNYMSNQDAADYARWYYGLDMSENTVANAVSASMDSTGHLIPQIVERMRANGYVVIDETMARSMGRWAYIVAACSGGAVLIASSAGRSGAALEEALGPIWDIPKVTDEHSAYPDKDRQSDFVHNLRSAEEPVYVWLTLFGEHAAEAGIDPRAEFERIERAVIPPLVDMIRSNPDVRLVNGAELPSVEPLEGGGGGGGGGGGDAAPAEAIRSILPAPPAPSDPAAASASPPLPPPPRAGDIALKRRAPPPPPQPSGSRRSRGGGGLARIVNRAAAPQSPSQRRPTPGEIAAYRRDSTTYFALLCIYRVAACINTAPPIVALAMQRATCAVLEGYGDSHPVKTRYENAMPCLFYYTQVDGMPPHSNDVERIIRNVPKRYMDAHVQFKGPRGMAVGSRKMTIGANARARGMSVGRAVTYALADPEWNILDGPPAEAERPVWMPPGGVGSSGAG